MKFLILLILLFPGSAFAAGPEELAVRGDYAGAAALYLQQARAADQKGNHAMAVPAQLNAATCMKMSGDVSAAALHLETARKWASPDATPGSRLELLALEGSIQVLSKRPANAVTTLQEALALAGTHGDLSLRIDILNDLGIALSACGKHDESITNFSKALALSDSDGEKHFRARQTSWSRSSRHDPPSPCFSGDPRKSGRGRASWRPAKARPGHDSTPAYQLPSAFHQPFVGTRR